MSITIPEQEIELQKSYMDAVKRINYRPQKYFIVTLGCQMNVRDSQTLAGMLEEMGYTQAESKEKADLILYNTCCVRENAENRALGNVIWLKELKKLKPRLLICVGGCMMQEDGVAESLKRQYPFIDIIFGTFNYHRFPQLLYTAIKEQKPVVEVLDGCGDIAEGLPAVRASKYMAFVNVMYGCNNFCSYCIVPYVRGRERSRRREDILDEVKGLVDSGVKEIMLLGQNVNSYQGGGDEFAKLLRDVDEAGVERIRFMTSHPKDLSDELIASFGTLKHLAGQLHLPVQSGSDRILQLMNRRYTAEKYLRLVEKLRSVRCDIGITSDIIVGFPGETADDFEDTLELTRQARFDAAFTFIFSPRAGTKAAEMPDETPDEVKTERIQRLIQLQHEMSAKALESQIGHSFRVLVEGVSPRDDKKLCGKTERGFMVNFPGNNDMIGQFVDVRITAAGTNTLRGEAV